MAKAQTAAAPLQLEAKIPLGPVSGRIDHLAIDLRRQWLSIAELGNDSVGVIDVANRKPISTMRGFQEPQGIAYEGNNILNSVGAAGLFIPCVPDVCFTPTYVLERLEAQMRVDDRVLKNVVFVGVEGNGPFVPLGTGSLSSPLGMGDDLGCRSWLRRATASGMARARASASAKVRLAS